MILSNVMTRRPAFAIIRSAALPAVALFIIADFAGFAIFGSNGLLQLAGYRAETAAHQRTLDSLKLDHDRLVHHSALLDPRHVDPDYADEIVRRDTGQIRPDEVIIPRD